MPYLVFNLNDGNEFLFDLLEERLSLGRNQRNEIVIDNTQISSFHAEFARQPNGGYLLTDLKSSNGTYVNGRRIESAALKSGDRVRFGQLEARYREMDLPDPSREKKGPARSAEEKRRDAESTEGPGSRTDFIPPEKAPMDAIAPSNERRTSEPKVQTLAPTSPPSGSCSTIPKPAPTPLQIVAKPPTPPPQTTTHKVPAAPTPQTARTPAPITSAPESQEDLTELRAKLADAQAQLDRLRDDHSKELEKFSAERTAMEKEKTALGADLVAARKEVEKLGQERSDRAKELEKWREDKEREIAALAEQGTAQHTLLQTLSKRRAGLEEVVATLERTVEDANKRLAGIESRTAELEATSAARRTELGTARAAVEQAEEDLRSHRSETQAAAAAKERHLAEHEEVKSRLATVSKLLEETLARHREAESHAIDAKVEARKHQTKLDALLATAAEKASQVASLDERHRTLSEGAARLEAEEAARRERLASLEKQLAENTEKLAQVEASHSEAVRALQATKDQAESLRVASGTLNIEVSAVKTALHDLVTRRTSEEERAAVLAGMAARRQQEIEEAEHQLDGLRQLRAQGEEGFQQLRDRIAQEHGRLTTARSGVEAAESQLAELQRDIGECETTLAAKVDQLTKQVEDLRREEDGLTVRLQTNREQLRHEEASFEDLRQKRAAEEARYAEILRSGDKLLSLNEAVLMLEAREREASRSLGAATGQEQALQVRLNALIESVASEQRRLDQTLRERAHKEEDGTRALEKAGRDLEEAKHRASEEAKQLEISLTARLKERVRELEEKHEALRRGLQASTDEKTVILFANDIIKRIDLIDILIQRVTGPGINGGMEQQLRTLRASFEDILAGHGIAEFKVAPGTEVDVGLRQQIAIVESVSGPARPRVVESFRPGFIYSCEPGREIVLRKVEVKTSSE